MAKKGQILNSAERLKISQRTQKAMQRPEVKQHLKERFTPERRKNTSEFHKIDAKRPERIAISIANLPAPMRRETNPSWHGGHNKKCTFCEADFWVSPSRETTAKYCSRQCKDLAQRTKLTGTNNPNWRGKFRRHCVICGREFEVTLSRYKTKCLVIWEEELENEKVVVDKIGGFAN